MKFLHLVTLAPAALALPSESLSARQTTTCTSPKVRKSWAQANSTEKLSYINAVLCLATKPSRLNISTHTTLYDDFGYVHSHMAMPYQVPVHNEPVFLPWHRYFVQVYEDALRSECNYTGAAMYWDWTADWAAPSKAAVWDTPLGFGGNGSVSADGNGPGKLRIAYGPFRNLRPTYWYDTVDPHWLSRDWSPGDGQPEMNGNLYGPTKMDEVNSWTVYERFQPALESGPHGAVHGGIASGRGDMGPSSSPNDPIFFLHHAMVDRVWWEWQQRDPANRTYAYKGVRNNGQSATLGDVMPMLGLAPDALVYQYMDTRGSKLCYIYS